MSDSRVPIPHVPRSTNIRKLDPNSAYVTRLSKTGKNPEKCGKDPLVIATVRLDRVAHARDRNLRESRYM